MFRMFRKMICLVSFVFVLGLASTALASVENIRQSTDDNLWSNSADWSLGNTPANTEHAIIVARKHVLIITGEDYKGHKWRQTTPVLKSSCEHDLRLLVDVTENLGKLQSMDLSEYDTVVMHFKNYDPQVPGRPGYQKIAEFVQNGGGLVLVHFACGAFQEFKDDFVKLAGRVWNPKLRGHDPFGEFTVHITDHTHPITVGLKDFKTRDELYTCLDGDTPITVLAQATSKVDKKIYPIAFVLTYGRGRVFHCILGHNADALSNAGAAKLFRRGVAWTVGLKPTLEKETAARKPEKLKVVLWIGGHSHDFESIARITTDFLAKRIPVEIKVVRDGSFLGSPDANQLDVILMNHCYNSAKGVLNEEQKQALLELVHSGTGIVAIHASYYSFVKWDKYHDKFFGARFTQHGKVDVMLEVTIVDKKHPITKGLDEVFETHSELYESTPVPKDCCILAYSKQEGKSRSQPSVWTKTYGGGRIVTILPAHWPDAYHVAGFQKLITASVLWAAHKK